MQKSFAFDIGTNSIGWCVLELDALNDPIHIIDAGVRIFSDGREPKSGASLAEGRRLARGMARRRDRYKRRRKAVIRTLIEYGLMPGEPQRPPPPCHRRSRGRRHHARAVAAHRHRRRQP